MFFTQYKHRRLWRFCFVGVETPTGESEALCFRLGASDTDRPAYVGDYLACVGDANALYLIVIIKWLCCSENIKLIQVVSFFRRLLENGFIRAMLDFSSSVLAVEDWIVLGNIIVLNKYCKKSLKGHHLHCRSYWYLSYEGHDSIN